MTVDHQCILDLQCQWQRQRLSGLASNSLAIPNSWSRTTCQIIQVASCIPWRILRDLTRIAHTTGKWQLRQSICTNIVKNQFKQILSQLVQIGTLHAKNNTGHWALLALKLVSVWKSYNIQLCIFLLYRLIPHHAAFYLHSSSNTQNHLVYIRVRIEIQLLRNASDVTAALPSRHPPPAEWSND